MSRAVSAGVGVDPTGGDEHGGAAFLAHRPVVGVPVVVLAAGSREDLPQQDPQPLVVHLGTGVVGTYQLGAALDSGPLPSCADDHSDGRVGPQMVELAGTAGGD